MNFNNILFLDIETVSQHETYEELSADWKELWDTKAQFLLRNKENESTETIYPRASIYAEFGKIVCISCGCLQGFGEERKLVIKSFSSDDERTLLKEFSDMLKKNGQQTITSFYVHIMVKSLIIHTSAGV